ncbi:MAG: MFS transporter [Xanthomonadales bacterium]|jgi:MFS family permease|nr:MFS transporter [Xanthomonadales bacterium]
MLKMQERLSLPFLMLLSLPATAMGFALAVQISALSWLLSTKYQLDIHEIGIVWAAGPLAGIVGQILIGIISDRVWLWGGRRRPFILVGGLLTALSLLALPSIGLIDRALGLDAILGVAIAVTLTLDLSINISFNPTRSLITDVTPEGPMRTAAYTWMQTVSGSFGVLAYAVGAIFGNIVLIYFGAVLVLLFSLIPPLLVAEPKPDATSAHAAVAQRLGLPAILLLMRPLWPFALYAVVAMGLKLTGQSEHSLWIEAGFAALAVAFLIHALSERHPAPHQASEDLPAFRKVLAANALSWIAMQTMFVYMIAFVQQRFPDLDDRATGQLMSMAFLALNLVGALTPALLLNPLARRYGEVRVHAASLGVLALGFAFVYLAGTSATAVYVGMAIMGLGWGAIVSMPFAIFSQCVAPARIGLYMGVFNLSVVLPQLAVSLGVGLVIQQLPDKGNVFLIGAVAAALSALAWSAVRRVPLASAGGSVAVVPGGGGH